MVCGSSAIPTGSLRSGAVTDDEHQIGYKVVPKGTPVEASDGTVVGRVHKVLDNVREHIFDGIVIATDDGKRFVDAPEVKMLTNRRVVLTISPEAVADLQHHKGLRGNIEKRAERRVNRLKRRLGRD
jgi:hypothetical protein